MIQTSGEDSDVCALAFLDQGAETLLGYKKLLADYVGQESQWEISYACFAKQGFSQSQHKYSDRQRSHFYVQLLVPFLFTALKR